MAPSSFYQVYTLYGYVHGEAMALAWALLPNKSQASYTLNCSRFWVTFSFGCLAMLDSTHSAGRNQCHKVDISSFCGEGLYIRITKKEAIPESMTGYGRSRQWLLCRRSRSRWYGTGGCNWPTTSAEPGSPEISSLNYGASTTITGLERRMRRKGGTAVWTRISELRIRRCACSYTGCRSASMKFRAVACSWKPRQW